MASVTNFGQYGSHLTNLVLGQEKHNYQLIKEDRDHRMTQKLKEEEIKAGNMTALLGPMAGVVGGAAGTGLMNQLGSLFGGGAAQFDPQGLSMQTGPQGWTSGYGQKGWKNQSYFG